jgi:hypothetical protein
MSRDNEDSTTLKGGAFFTIRVELQPAHNTVVMKRIIRELKMLLRITLSPSIQQILEINVLK